MKVNWHCRKHGMYVEIKQNLNVNLIDQHKVEIWKIEMDVMKHDLFLENNWFPQLSFLNDHFLLLETKKVRIYWP